MGSGGSHPRSGRSMSTLTDLTEHSSEACAVQLGHCSLDCDATTCECGLRVVESQTSEAVCAIPNPMARNQLVHQQAPADAQHSASCGWTEQLEYCTHVQRGASCCSQPMRIKHLIPALHRAAADGLLGSLRKLGALGQLDYRAPQMAGATALHVAAQCGQAQALRTLADLGTPVDLTSDDGSTPLYMACLYCRSEAIKVLLELGSDPCQPSVNGCTPIDVACPKSEKLLTQWQRFSLQQRSAVRMHG